MSEEINAIRNKVVQKFCRTVLWIDDEIHLDQGLAAEGTSPLFKDKFEEFTKSGLLCHMMGFPETRSGSDPYASQSEVNEVLQSCVSLALQSDIVIVDWMLGSTDSSEHAERIIKQVVGKDKGFRFIVVLSNKDDFSDSTFVEFDPPFSKSDDFDDLWKNEYGQFLLNLRKDEFKDKNLFDTICNALLKVYPDYLHLAALEIAGRIKEQVPRWLSNIPAGADWGILVERGNTFKRESWNTEIQEGIIENLLEDLSLTIQGQALETLNPEMLNYLANERSRTLSSVSATEEFQDAFNALKKCVDAIKPKRIAPERYKELLKWENNNDVKGILESVETFAEFYDIRSCRNYDVGQVCPGCIYEGLNGVSTSIAVCITAGCDCAWGKSFLFLVGNPIRTMNSTIPDYSELNDIIKGKRTVLRFNQVSYLFINTADSVLVKKRSEISPLTIKGVVRRDILNRLIGRYMSHTQRFGVNQPEIVRKLRDE